jgi:hypothetical protein
LNATKAPKNLQKPALSAQNAIKTKENCGKPEFFD